MAWARRARAGGGGTEIRTQLDGYSFASKLEAAVYGLLKLRMYAGEIATIQVQDHVRVCGPQGHEDCPRKIDYVADFKCTRVDGTTFHAEAKGYPSDVWALKKALYRHYGPDPLEVYEGKWHRPVLTETINP